MNIKEELEKLEKRIREEYKNNPIQDNPHTPNAQVIRVGQDNVPKDKKVSDEDKKKVYNELEQLEKRCNEKSNYTKDSDSIPAGSNITQGPAGGKMFEEPSWQSDKNDKHSPSDRDGTKPAVIYK